jgi:hypothetical protein
MQVEEFISSLSDRMKESPDQNSHFRGDFGPTTMHPGGLPWIPCCGSTRRHHFSQLGIVVSSREGLALTTMAARLPADLVRLELAASASQRGSGDTDHG